MRALRFRRYQVAGGSNPPEPVLMGGRKLAKKFSVLEHELIPKHEIAHEKEVEEVLKKYQCEKGQLPLIRTSDPNVKEIGAKSGDVIKITRKSPTAGKAIAYRYVVEA